MLKSFKKFTCLAVSLFIILALFPFKATAVDYNLWVGDTEITSSTASGDGWRYSGSETSGTLTLTDANITSKHESANIYCNNDNLNLTIVLQGNNSLGNAVNQANYGIYAKCRGLTIQGPGTLDIQSSGIGIQNEYYNGSIYITNGASITITSSSGILTEHTLGISNGSVTVNKVNDANGIGICSGANLNISNSSVTVNNARDHGIYSFSNINISGNSFVSSKSESDATIHADGTITLNGPQILEPEGGSISSDSHYITDNSGNVANTVVIGVPVNIDASANPTGGGTITSEDIYAYNNTITLTATPNTGYSFVNWTEDGEEVSTNPSYAFTVTGDRALVANFVPTHTLTVSANPTDGGTVSGGGTYDLGTSATLTATPNEGYRFVNWTENGTQVSTDAEYSFTVEEDRNLVANFVQTHYVTISSKYIPTTDDTPSTAVFNVLVKKNGEVIYNDIISLVGDVSTQLEFDHGNNVTITLIYTSDKYNFVNWTENGEEVGTNAEYSFDITEDHNLVANFVQTPEVSVTANPTEGGTATGDGTYDYNSTATVRAIPNEHYHFVNWTESGTVVSTDAEYTFTVTGNRTLVANFEIDTHEVSVTANPNEGGTVSGGGTFNYGTEITLTATPNSGYKFVNWTEKEEETVKKSDDLRSENVVSTDNPYVLTIDRDRELTGNFELQTYTIKFLNYDGTELQSSEFAYGETPVYTGKTPTKSDDDQYTYTFAGWDPEITEVTEDATYTAIYSAEEKTEHSESEGDNDDIIPITDDDKDAAKSDTQEEKTETSESSNAPNTGNETNISLWLTALIASSMGLILVLILNKKRSLSAKHYR